MCILFILFIYMCIHMFLWVSPEMGPCAVVLSVCQRQPRFGPRDSPRQFLAVSPRDTGRGPVSRAASEVWGLICPRGSRYLPKRGVPPTKATQCGLTKISCVLRLTGLMSSTKLTGLMWVWVIKPPGIGPQVLVHASIFQSSILGTYC